MDPCIFCRIAQGMEPSYPVFENKHVLAFLDNNPFTQGHTLVIPKRHYINMFDIDEEALEEVVSVVHLLVKRYEKIIGMSGVDILNLSGVDGQQTVYHFHIHIIPRFPADNLVSWIKSIPRVESDFKSTQKKLMND
ncbi:MAG: HIT family protein [Thermoplasmataceae archaeon]